MRREWLLYRIVTAGLIGIVASVLAAAAPEPTAAEAAAPASMQVRPASGAAPFTVEQSLLHTRAGYRVYKLTYPSPVVTDLERNNRIPAEYYVPLGAAQGGPPRPAVVCLHILNGNYELVRFLSSVLVRRGIPVLWFKLPYYGEREPPGGRRVLLSDTQLFASALTQALEDVTRSIDVLSARPEVDPEHIGVAGISLGGILAASAAGRDARLSRAVLILAGGDLPGLLRTAPEAGGLRAFLAGLPAADRVRVEATLRAADPLTYAPRLRELAAAGRVLMINAAEDRTMPRASAQRLAAGIGMTDDVVWLDGLGHYTAMAALPQVATRAADFFALDLSPQLVTAAVPRAAAEPTPLARVAGLVQQLGDMLAVEPKAGLCHFADLTVSVILKNGKTHSGRIRYLRGSGSRFVLDVSVPGVTDATLGQGTHPWLAAPGKRVFHGTEGGTGAASPLAYAAGANVMKLRMLTGLIGSVAMAPALLEQWVSVQTVPAVDGAPVLALQRREHKDRIEVQFDADGTTPATLRFDVDDVKGEIRFRQWRSHTIGPDALFEPPPAELVQAVSSDDIVRTFGALFDFGLEKLQ